MLIWIWSWSLFVENFILFSNQFNMSNQAGLCSAVNATFIATMQPSPVDTTNALLSQLIQISLQGSTATQPMTTTIKPPFGDWTQMLAYSSLLFSLLAAFGAIMGKHWLGHYKTTRHGRGTREERCKQRHHKFQQLQMWHFENVLQSFTVLLYISLGLFVMFLGSAVWTQDRAVSILSIGGASFGMVFYIICSCLSVKSPDCPFQTPTSPYIRRLISCFHIPSHRRRDDDDDDDDVSTTFWILDTSTDLDVLRTASKFIMTINQIHPLDRLCQTMLKRLKGCFGINITFQHDALVYGEVLLHIYLSFPSARPMICANTHNWTDWKSWRDLYLPRALKHYIMSYHEMLKSNPQQHQQALETIRTALRMVVATGSTGFVDPDDEDLARDDSSHLGFSLSDVDAGWLIDCAERFSNVGNYVAARYPLFLLSSALKKSSFPIRRITPFLNKKLVPDNHLRAMAFRVARVIALRVACALEYEDSESLCDDSFSQGILSAICPCSNHDDKDFTDVMSLLKFSEWPPSSDLEFCTLHDTQLLALLVLPTPNVDSTNCIPYYEALIRYMDSRQPDSDVIRHIALRKAYNVRQYLPGSLRSKLSPALSALLYPIGEQSDQDFYCYVRLMFSVAKRPDWRLYLEEDVHEKYIGTVQTLIQESSNGLNKPSPYLFYIAGILLRIFHPQHSSSHCTAIPPNQWWDLMRIAWRVAGESYDDQSHVSDVLDDGVEMLEALATETERCILGNTSTPDLQFLQEWLKRTVEKLSERSGVPQSIVSAVKDLRRVVHFRLVRNRVGVAYRQLHRP